MHRMVLGLSSLQIHNKRAYTGLHLHRRAGRWFLPLHQEMELKVSTASGRHTGETGSSKSSANMTACWRARNPACQCSPASTLPGSHGLLVRTRGWEHPLLPFRLPLNPAMKPVTTHGPCQAAPRDQVWSQHYMEQEPEDSHFLLHSGNEISHILYRPAN